MAEMTKILVLVNPRSGTHRCGEVLKAIRNFTAEVGLCKFTIKTTESCEHTRKQVLHAVEKGYFAVLVAGGDGTVGSVGHLLKGTETALGIIPTGSGNGVARHLGIDTEVKNSLRQILHSKIYKVDTMQVNGQFCLGVCGVGFEAQVAKMFNRSEHRGFVSYSKHVLSEFFKFKTSQLYISVEGHILDLNPFTLTVANSSQWGNDFQIAPKASMVSGSFELISVNDVNEINVMPTVYALVSGAINTLPWCKSFPGTTAAITSQKPFGYHIDGEYMGETSALEITLEPASLHILSPRKDI